MQRNTPESITILMADDDADDRMLAADAMKESRLGNTFRCVEDGQELMDYLMRRGKYSHGNAPRPGLILLDLNMPRKDGRQALQEIKSDPELRRIPVVMFTTSRRAADMERGLSLGATRFEIKPSSYPALVAFANELADVARG